MAGIRNGYVSRALIHFDISSLPFIRNACYCGEEPGVKADESLCNVKCRGNSTLICGAYHYNSVYGIVGIK